MTYDFDHIGRRIEHLMDLHKMWSDGYAILTRPNMHHSPSEYELAEKFKSALSLLSAHMAKDYNQSIYAKEINRLDDILGIT